MQIFILHAKQNIRYLCVCVCVILAGPHNSKGLYDNKDLALRLGQNWVQVRERCG